MIEMPRSNPYVGPRPFDLEDAPLFYGRDQEARNLVSLVVSQKLVLYYAQSGAGKTSMINASLRPELEKRGFFVLPCGRVGGQAVSDHIINIYVYNLLLSLDGNQHDPADLAGLTMKDYLGSLLIPDLSPEQAEVLGPNAARPLALIIDQFEEIFTAFPEAWSQRAAFFDQLCEAMECDPYLWVVLAAREDYIARLDPYAYRLPDRLRTRFFMQRMGYDAALDAVKKPVERLTDSRFSGFENGVAEELVTSLGRMRVGKDENGYPLYQEDEFIEPVQLQVVCYQLWDRLKENVQDQRAITMEDLRGLAGGRDRELSEFIDNALSNFYEDAIHRVIEKYNKSHPGNKLTERQVREWFSEKLITSAGTRSYVFRDEKKHVTGGTMPNEAVDLLESEFIIRSETRSSDRWYELVHERLAEQILESNKDWFTTHTTQLTRDVAAWKASGQDNSLLYSGKRLAKAEKMLKAEDLTLEEGDFIKASQDYRRKQRVLITLIIVTLISFLIFGVISIQSAWEARKQAARAQLASSLAYKKQDEAQAASTRAVQNQENALSAQKTAEAARIQAQDNQQKAEEKQLQLEEALKQVQAAEKASLANKLAFASNSLLRAQPDISLLFAVAAWDAGGTWESRQTLQQAVWAQSTNPFDIQFTKGENTIRSGSAVIEVIEFFPNDRYLVIGGWLGGLQFWDLDENKSVDLGFPKGQLNSYIYSVSFSPDGRYLAIGGGDGVYVWDYRGKAKSLITVYRNIESDSYITEVAFSPDGKFLASADKKGKVSLYQWSNTEQAGAKFYALKMFTHVYSLAWSSKDTNFLAYGASDGLLEVWDIRNNTTRPLFTGMGTPINGLVWSLDGEYLFAGAEAGDLMKLRVKDGQRMLASEKGLAEGIFSLTMHPKGNILLTGTNTGGSDRTAILWDANTLIPIGTPGGHYGRVNVTAFDPSGTYFATGGTDRKINIWKIINAEMLAKDQLRVEGGEIENLSVDRDGKFYLIQRTGAGLIALDETGTNIYGPFPDSSTSLALLPNSDKRTLILGQVGQVVLMHGLGTKAPYRDMISFPGKDARQLAIGKNGTRLAVALCKPDTGALKACSPSEVQFLDISEVTKPRLLIHEGWKPAGQRIITSLGLPFDGETLVIGYADGGIQVFNITGFVPMQLNDTPVTDSAITRMAFSPDGTLAAFNSESGALLLWDWQARRPIGILGAEGAMAGSASGRQGDASLWTPIQTNGLVFVKNDGRLKLISATAKGLVREWDVDPVSWQERACRVAGRPLTLEAWKQYIVGVPDSQFIPACQN